MAPLRRSSSYRRSAGGIGYATALSPIPEESKSRVAINQRQVDNICEAPVEADATPNIHSQCEPPPPPPPPPMQFQHHQPILYGRLNEMDVLNRAYQRSISHSPEVVLIQGRSGTGKTALASTLRPLVENDAGYFISGKFEDRLDREPYAVFVEALDQFVELLLSETSSQLQRVREAINNSVGQEGQLLIDMIPSLEHVIGRQGEASKVYGSEALHRFRFIFSKFLTAIASVGVPLVIFIDDLQWADISSLDLLQSLLLYPSTHQEQISQNSSLLVILAYRDDYGAHSGDALGEYSPSFQVPAFAAYLNRLIMQGQRGTLRISEVALGNLNPSFVNELLAGHLQLSPHETFTLTQVVYNNTHGNVFHVLQYLGVLMDQGLLFQDDEGHWRWDCRELESQAAVSETVVDLVQYKMDQLPPIILDALKVASCMGNEIDDEAVSFVLGTNEISKHLSFAEEQGLIVFLPDTGRYRFAHDRIQQVAFALIDDPQALCLKIGRTLLKASSSASLDENIFVLVNLFNQGSTAIGDPRERYEVANLNLLAGEKAIALSAFPDASRYLEHGIELIRDDHGHHWESYYELSLRLYESFAEAEVCNQNFSRVRELINEVFDHSRCWEDRLRTYAVLLHSMGQQDNLQEATNVGIEVLRELGEDIPTTTSKWVVLKDLLRTQYALRGMSDQDLLSLGNMTDQRKIACSQILNIMFVYTYQARSPFTALIAFRSIRLCLKYGHFPGSAQAFAMYGMIICGLGLDPKAGHRFGQLAMSLLEATNAKELTPRVHCIVYGGINHWMHPLKDSLEHLQQATRIGMEIGNVEFASIATGFRCTYSLFSGAPLPLVESELVDATRQMRRYKQVNTLLMTSLPLQFIHNVTGRADNPKILSGQIVNFDTILREAGDTNNLTVVAAIYLYAADLAYMFGEFELAGVMAAENRNLQKAPSALFAVTVVRFKEGMIAVALARNNIRRSANIKTAKQSLNKFKKWAKTAPMNFDHRAKLIEAELKSLHGGNRIRNLILDLYDQAIAVATQERYLHEAALACEKAGEYLYRFGAVGEAISYWNRSHELYLEWGATFKAAHLQASVASLLRGEK